MLNARMTDPGSEPPAGVKVHPYLSSRISPDVQIEMLRLHQSIETLLPNRLSKVIQFIGPEGGEGTTAIVNAFGDVVSRRIGKSVISIDIEEMEEQQSRRNTSDRRLLTGPQRLEGLPGRRGITNVVGLQGVDRTFRQGRSVGETLFQRGTLSAYWDRLSAATDLILLDTPSAVRSASGLAVAPTADGVVLVIEANRSGYATVRRAKEDIERSGGHLLGVVLNKKRRYLPRFLERWV